MTFLDDLFQNRSGGPWIEGYTITMGDPNKWLHHHTTRPDKTLVDKRVWINLPIYVNGKLFCRVSTSSSGWYVDDDRAIKFIEMEHIKTVIIVPKLEV